MKRRDFLASVSILALDTTLRASFESAIAAPPSEAVIVIGSGETGIANQDPIRGTLTGTAASLIYDRLIEQDVDQSYHPHLATSWETSPDGLNWTFKLRQGVRFHDGEPFNAATIAWWIPKYKGTVNEYLTDAIDHVEVIDDYTVCFLMKRPEPNLIYNLSNTFMGIPSPKSFDAAGDGYGITEAVGTGPYKLERFTVGQETVLIANEDYTWGCDLSENKMTAYIKRLTLREITDASTAFLELITGGVGMLLAVPDDFMTQLKGQGNIDFRNLAGSGETYLVFNTQAEPFADRRVRQATALAINQTAVHKSVFNDMGLEAHQFLISTLSESKVDPQFEIHYDPTRANTLLDEAGWTRGSDGIRRKDGNPLKIKLWTQSETEFKRLAEVIQAQLKSVGMDSEIVTFDSATIRDQLKKGQHQLVINKYEWNNADILDWFFSAKRIPYPNSTRWNDPKSEELHDIAMYRSRTWAERVANYTKYHEYLLSQYVFVPVHEVVQNIAFNTTVLTVPQAIRGTQLSQATIVDMKTVE